MITARRRAGCHATSWIRVCSIRVLLVTCVLSACYDVRQESDVVSVGVWDVFPEQRWTLSEDLRIGELSGHGPAAFGDIRCLGIDPMERIWIVDAQSAEIRVFQSDGLFVRGVGGKGEGPSEFQHIGDVFPGPGDEIWVEDRSLRRYEVFDTAGNRIGGHRVVISNMSSAPRAWTQQGLFVVGDLRVARFYEQLEGGLVGGAISLVAPTATGRRASYSVRKYRRSQRIYRRESAVRVHRAGIPRFWA